MSILDRLNLLIRSEWNARGSARDERRALVAEARRSLADIIADERRLRLAYQDALDEAHRLQERAESLLRRGNERAARSSLMDRERVLRDAASIREQVEKQQVMMVDLQGAVDQLETREGGGSGVGGAEKRRSSAREEVEREQRANPDAWRWPEREGGQSSGRGASGGRAAESPGRRLEAIGGEVATHSRAASGGAPGDAPEARWAAVGRGGEELEVSEDAFARFEEMSGRIAVQEARAEASRVLSRDAASDGEEDPLEQEFRRMEAERKLRRLRDRAASEEEEE